MTKKESYIANAIHFDGSKPLQQKRIGPSLDIECFWFSADGESFRVNSGRGGKFKLRGKLTNAETAYWTPDRIAAFFGRHKPE